LRRDKYFAESERGKVLIYKNLLKRIHQGEIIQLEKNLVSFKFINRVRKMMKRISGERNLLLLESNLSREEMFNLSNNLKSEISNSPILQKLISHFLISLGFIPKYTYYDRPRLRILPTYLHRIRKAKNAFAIHRDTWYGNPESQINFWIPLYPVNFQNSFAIFPDYFQVKVPNDSDKFNYDDLKKSGGFQSKNSNRVFPSAKTEIDEKNLERFKMKAGEILVFSAQHLHGTRPNLSGKTRFSIDFRAVDIRFLNKVTFLNIDNKSKGSILEDMILVSDS
jgi:hypothetical protein